ncbi:MAG: DEAD/DEAH box helicase, partial [Proteobacteria bacterium]|nr:DEAD/DEAH box helicase [Pseudomonadota bacterium]
MAPTLLSSKSSSLSNFSVPTQLWFTTRFGTATPVQNSGWTAITKGEHSLLLAPTGSGKTLAAFLACIDRLSQLHDTTSPGVRVLYISPLKALVHDIEYNLHQPIQGIACVAEEQGIATRSISVDMRTGDTTQQERRRQARKPADILITTPESLFLILGSAARETLRHVETVIVDEIHVMAGTKRGVHLALSLERLSELTKEEPQRIGLSATQRPLERIARFLGGARPVTIIDASGPPQVDLKILVPVADMENPTTVAAPVGLGQRQPVGGNSHQKHQKLQHGLWPTIFPRLLDAINAHQTTIVFTNSRILCERIAQQLNELAEGELVRAHHGSISHQQRATIEGMLKAGQLRGLIATSSLELGIDMGAIDLVILVESPGSVARGLQRVGRAGHRVGETSEGHIFPKFRGDLLECVVVADKMLAGQIESTRPPRNCLDVLAQQIIAMCSIEDWNVEPLLRLIKEADPYSDLSRDLLDSVLDMLAGRYPSQEFADLSPKLNWNRQTDCLSARRGTRMLSVMNPGTIPDRGNYRVTLGSDGPRIGELDEEMVHESRRGDRIILGASTWQIEEITRDRVIVSPAPGQPGRLPFWHGERPGRPIELGKAIGAFLREFSEVPPSDEVDWLLRRSPMNADAATNLARFLAEQKEATEVLPTDRTIVIERFRDELGDWRVCLMTPFGSRV